VLVSRPIQGPCTITDPNAFSDASSGMIWLNGWWCLVLGWKADSRDIGWAEAALCSTHSISIIEQLEPSFMHDVQPSINK
jgi:hypothetical protein